MKKRKRDVNLLNLPYELFFVIFSHLSARDLCSVNLTCKDFYDVISDPILWRTKMRCNKSFKKLSILMEGFVGIPNAKTAQNRSNWAVETQLKNLKIWKYIIEIVNQLSKMGYKGMCGGFKYNLELNTSFKRVWKGLFICKKFFTDKIKNNETYIKIKTKDFYLTLKKEEKYFPEIEKVMELKGYKFVLFRGARNHFNLFIAW